MAIRMRMAAPDNDHSKIVGSVGGVFETETVEQGV
jgi:hypothetical protein